MNDMLLKLYVKFQDLASREEGQDLVEYALVVALIAFGATAGMKQSGQRHQHRIQQRQLAARRFHQLVPTRNRQDAPHNLSFLAGEIRCLAIAAK